MAIAASRAVDEANVVDILQAAAVERGAMDPLKVVPASQCDRHYSAIHGQVVLRTTPLPQRLPAVPPTLLWPTLFQPPVPVIDAARWDSPFGGLIASAGSCG